VSFPCDDVTAPLQRMHCHLPARSSIGTMCVRVCVGVKCVCVSVRCVYDTMHTHIHTYTTHTHTHTHIYTYIYIYTKQSLQLRTYITDWTSSGPWTFILHTTVAIISGNIVQITVIPGSFHHFLQSLQEETRVSHPPHVFTVNVNVRNDSPRQR
jgi:hypothetical protein